MRSAAAARPAAPRRPALRRFLIVNGVTLAVIVAWAGAAALLPPYQLPRPTQVAAGFFWFLSTAQGARHLTASVLNVGTSMLLSLAAGLVVAMLPYYVPVLRLAIDKLFTPFMNSFSGLGWTMLAIVWFGIGFGTVVFAVTVILLPFMVVNIREGVASVDRELVEMGRSFGRSRWREFVKILLPLLYPFIFAALRISFGVAWKVTLTAELLGGTEGLGYLANIARQELNTSQVFAIIAIIIALVFLANRLVFDPLQRQLSRARLEAA